MMGSIDKLSAKNPLLPTFIVAAAFLVIALIFIANVGSWFVAFLTVHVIFVVLWIGGGLLLTILGIKAQLSNDPAELFAIARQAAFVGKRIFAPAGIVVVVMGAAMVQNADIGYGHFWIIFGLLGFLSTFVTGVAVLAPRSEKLLEIVKAQGAESPAAVSAVTELLLIARVDVAILLLVIVDMVARPFS